MKHINEDITAFTELNQDNKTTRLRKSSNYVQIMRLHEELKFDFMNYIFIHIHKGTCFLFLF